MRNFKKKVELFAKPPIFAVFSAHVNNSPTMEFSSTFERRQLCASRRFVSLLNPKDAILVLPTRIRSTFHLDTKNVEVGIYSENAM